MIMPYQEPCTRRTRRCCGCASIITTILSIVLAATVGLIVGTLAAETFFPAVSALIVLGVVFLVLLISNLIVRFCKHRCDND